MTELRPLTRLPDGTVKQVNPFTGTQVWTVPGRGRRPGGAAAPAPGPAPDVDPETACPFCVGRLLETPPELARVVREGERWPTRRIATADELDDTVPQVRLIPNLFSILSFDYWHRVHGFEPPEQVVARRDAWMATAAGRGHVEQVGRAKLAAEGVPAADLARRAREEADRLALEFFASSHLVVVPRRHVVDGPPGVRGLAGSGSLAPVEHAAYLRLTLEATRHLYETNPFVRYVAVFQNWLKPAGASFEHLHKQLVGIDEQSAQLRWEIDRVREDPDLYARWGAQYAQREGLVVARTDTAVAFAGVGHRYPSLEVHSLVTDRDPWQLDREMLRDVADLLHACHAATGPDVACNEEWHHRPPGLDLPIPLRVVLKWRISVPAGFEGVTKIFVNTIDPWGVRERTLTRLRDLRARGAISERVRIDGEV